MSKCLILFILFSIQVSATTFVPLSIKKQISDSSGVLVGEVINSQAFETKDGQILTKIFLKANKWIGVNPDHYHTEVYFPGGTVGDKSVQVSGTPKFVMGEQVVLMLKNYQGKNYLMNLGLGKFSIKKFGNTKILVNAIFPKEPKVGQMPLETFYKLAKRIKGERFQTRFKDKYELQVESESRKVKVDKRGRKIASVESRITQEDSKASTIWILLLFALFGAVFTLLKMQNKE
jgi:hypothetical protein